MDEIIVMENGRISETGTYEQLLHKKVNFIECLPSNNNNNDRLKNEDDNGNFETDHLHKLNFVNAVIIWKITSVVGDETFSSNKLQQETKCNRQINQTGNELESKNKSSPKMINEEKLQLKQVPTYLLCGQAITFSCDG